MIALSEITSIGFTGTQLGLTGHQRSNIISLLLQMPSLLKVRHGDCIGADEEFDALMRTEFHKLVIYSYPPRNPAKRAFVEDRGYTVVYPVAEYLDRNKSIVRDSDWLVAAPSSTVEQLRSGTWSTIRYAQQIGKPHTIVFP